MSDEKKVRGGLNTMSEGDPEPCGEKEGFNMDLWWEERSLSGKILWGIGFAILGIGLLALFGLAVMLLWNWLAPELFGLPRLDYWKAWGLLILCWILFKNWSFGSNESRSVERKRKKQLRLILRTDGGLAGEEAAASGEAVD